MKYLVVFIMLSLSCATAPAVPTVPPSDPLGVAENWARNPTEAPPFVSAWSAPGRVVRMHVEGATYKTLVVDRQGQSAEAVLLTITKTLAGTWEVTRVEESPSNYLFPEF